MKKIKTMIKAISILVAACVSTLSATAFFTTETTSWENYKQLDDKGMFTSDCRSIYLTPNDRLVSVFKFEDMFAFLLNENVSADDAYDDILGIIEDYFPNNNFNSDYDSEDENSAYISTGICDGNIYYSISSDCENTQEYSESIMQKLNEKELISAFYDCGQVGFEQEIHENYPNAYLAEDVDKEAVEQYINENNIDCTLQFVEASEIWYSLDSYVLCPAEEITTEENFELAVELYEAFEIIPMYSFLDKNTTVFGKNSLETTVLYGDANGDNELNISDAAFIARTLARRETIDVTTNPAADYNNDGKVTVSDAATIARDLAKK
ncbi:MAG: dockerin type I repeat-containing protein [Oscillospiraceae bacterium]|nr:dockerin type I repeat-containing protein [Oscillospiraceae bacterium]